MEATTACDMKILKWLKTTLLASIVSISASANAYDFAVDGFYYNILDETSVIVIGGGTREGILTVPSSVTYDGNTYSVTKIGDYAFYGCSGLTSIVIPNSVTSIGESAFNHCSGLTGGLTIPNSVTSIGESAFYGCSGLTGSLTIPKSVSFIGDEAFRECSGITSVVFNAEYCNILSDYCFAIFTGCNIESVTIGEAVRCMPGSIFEYCRNLTSVILNAEDCTSMGSASYPVFEDCNKLTSVAIGENVKTLPSFAFYDCSVLTSIKIPHSVKTIGEKAFCGCSRLTEVTLGKSVETIMADAFAGIKGMNKVISLNTIPPVCTDEVFNEVNKEKCKLYVPIGSKDVYAETYVWWDFINIIETEYSGVDDTAADALGISTTDGIISVAGSDTPMQVYDLSGKRVWQGPASQGARLTRGVYLVRIADTITKVAL